MPIIAKTELQEDIKFIPRKMTNFPGTTNLSEKIKSFNLKSSTPVNAH